MMWAETASVETPAHIGNFYALNIFEGKINSEVWYTKNTTCFEVKTLVDLNDKAKQTINIKWDKQAGDCKWLGLGVGWDAWSKKDLSAIFDSSSIQIRVKNKAGKIKSLPVAAALEDYSGNQAWIGLAADKINNSDDNDWSLVRLPINQFGWKEFNADPSSVKQLILQFEAAGDIVIGNIEIIENK